MHLLMTAETVFRPPIGQSLCRRAANKLCAPAWRNLRWKWLIMAEVTRWNFGRIIGCLASRSSWELWRRPPALIRLPSSRNGFKERSLLFGDSCIFEVRAVCFSAKCTRWIPLMSRWVPPLISSTVNGYALPDPWCALEGTDIYTRKLSATLCNYTKYPFPVTAPMRCVDAQGQGRSTECALSVPLVHSFISLLYLWSPVWDKYVKVWRRLTNPCQNYCRIWTTMKGARWTHN